MFQWIVTPSESGLKLIEFLKLKFPDSSSKQLKREIENNSCLLNGYPERFSNKVVGLGDTISFAKNSKKNIDSIDPSKILYQDAFIFIYNKPAGIPSDDSNFIKALMHLSSSSLYLVHRLDKETSGALIFAKSKDSLQAMIDMFKLKSVKKTYVAIVDGTLKTAQGTIDNYLGKLCEFQGQTIWGAVKREIGLKAVTQWKLKKNGANAALVLFYPITGRTHQIRVHASQMGHAILGDYQYGKTFRCSAAVPRCLLHAYELEFDHPMTHIKILVKAPVPNDMTAIIKLLFEMSL